MSRKAVVSAVMFGFGVSRYKTVYEQGLAKGYSVMSAWNWYGEETENTDLVIMTPHSVNGEPVFVTVSVELFHVGRDELRPYKVVETVAGFDATVLDAELEKEVGEFASAASQYPHVWLYNEFKHSMTTHAMLMGDDNPDVSMDKYINYLESCAKDMDHGQTYVGEIHSSSEIFIDGTKTPVPRDEHEHYYADHEKLYRISESYNAHRSKCEEKISMIKQALANANTEDTKAHIVGDVLARYGQNLHMK